MIKVKKRRWRQIWGECHGEEKGKARVLQQVEERRGCVQNKRVQERSLSTCVDIHSSRPPSSRQAVTRPAPSLISPITGFSWSQRGQMLFLRSWLRSGERCRGQVNVGARHELVVVKVRVIAVSYIRIAVRDVIVIHPIRHKCQQ